MRGARIMFSLFSLLLRSRERWQFIGFLLAFLGPCCRNGHSLHAPFQSSHRYTSDRQTCSAPPFVVTSGPPRPSSRTFLSLLSTHHPSHFSQITISPLLNRPLNASLTTPHASFTRSPHPPHSLPRPHNPPTHPLPPIPLPRPPRLPLPHPLPRLHPPLPAPIPPSPRATQLHRPRRRSAKLPVRRPPRPAQRESLLPLCRRR